MLSQRFFGMIVQYNSNFSGHASIAFDELRLVSARYHNEYLEKVAAARCCSKTPALSKQQLSLAREEAAYKSSLFNPTSLLKKL